MGEARRREKRIADEMRLKGIRRITRDRFDAFVAWTRHPIGRAISKEIEHYETASGKVLGALVMDAIDGDYGYACLGRDEKGRFRAVDFAFLGSLRLAREGLFRSLGKLEQANPNTFHQGDAADDPAGVDLFTPIVPENRWHPFFRLMQQSEHWSPAIGLLREMMASFVDVDGNFVEQFQTTAFDARLWELYLYAYFVEENLYVERLKNATDFSVSDGADRVHVEAVTVNPTNNTPTQLRAEPQLRSPDEIKELLKGKVPIKFGSALFTKLARRKPYWEMPAVTGGPLVFAIADFHEDQSMLWTSTALMEYLYGFRHEAHYEGERLVITPKKLEKHEFQGKTIPSGFFLQPNSENVSAVLFSSSGTIAKFNRKGKLAGFGSPNLRLIRQGFCHDHDPNAAQPRQFRIEIEPGACTESWAEGLSMFHNPRAIHPIDPGMFPSIAHHRLLPDGNIQSSLPDFHPHGSITLNIRLKNEP